jgi:hypothetical protein
MRAKNIFAFFVVVTFIAGAWIACTLPTAPAPPPSPINVTVNNLQGSQNVGATPTGAFTPGPGCGARKTTDLGWSVEGGLLPSGEPLARFAQFAPKGTVVQFDFTPKDSTGPLPSECHGAISYSTPSGPCTALTGSPESFNPRVSITATSGICQLRATVDGLSATAEIQAQ